MSDFSLSYVAKQLGSAIRRWYGPHTSKGMAFEDDSDMYAEVHVVVTGSNIYVQIGDETFRAEVTRCVDASTRNVP
jgi:hypothetical protein